jgi:hypothetical protein
MRYHEALRDVCRLDPPRAIPGATRASHLRCLKTHYDVAPSAVEGRNMTAQGNALGCGT